MNFTTYGLDIAKRVFQLYWVDHESGEIHNRKFGKQELQEFLAQHPFCCFCGGFVLSCD